MKLIAAAIFCGVLAAPCQAQYAKWGAENWSCGITTLPGTLGSGSDIWLKAIDGNASGGLSGATDPTGGMYQKLISIAAGIGGTGVGRGGGSPSNNNEIDSNLYSIILKQNGAGAVTSRCTSLSIRRSRSRTEVLRSSSTPALRTEKCPAWMPRFN